MAVKFVSTRYAAGFIAVVVMGSVAGCNTTNPNQGGFFGGVIGVASGNYEKGTEEKRVALQNEQDKKIALERKATRVNDERASVAQELAETEARLKAVEGDLSALNSKLAEAKASTDSERRQLADLQKKSEALSQDIDRERLTFSDDSSELRVKELERRKAELELQIQLYLLSS